MATLEHFLFLATFLFLSYLQIPKYSPRVSPSSISMIGILFLLASPLTNLTQFASLQFLARMTYLALSFSSLFSIALQTSWSPLARRESELQVWMILLRAVSQSATWVSAMDLDGNKYYKLIFNQQFIQLLQLNTNNKLTHLRSYANSLIIVSVSQLFLINYDKVLQTRSIHKIYDLCIMKIYLLAFFIADFFQFFKLQISIAFQIKAKDNSQIINMLLINKFINNIIYSTQREQKYIIRSSVWCLFLIQKILYQQFQSLQKTILDMLKLQPYASQKKSENQNIIKRFQFKQGKSSKINALKYAYQKIKLKKQLQSMEQKCKQFEEDQYCNQISKRMLQKKSANFQTSYMKYKNEQITNKCKQLLKNTSDCVIPHLDSRRKVRSSSQSKSQIKKIYRVVSLGYSERSALKLNDQTMNEDKITSQINLSMLINKIKQKSQIASKFIKSKSNWRLTGQIKYKHRNQTVSTCEPALRIHGRHSTPCRPWSTNQQKQGQFEMPQQPQK